MKSSPRMPEMVFAFAGDSTITRALPISQLLSLRRPWPLPQIGHCLAAPQVLLGAQRSCATADAPTRRHPGPPLEGAIPGARRCLLET